MKKTYQCQAKLWVWPGEQGNWHFVTVPKPVGIEIRTAIGKSSRGFGAVKVSVTVGDTNWLTSMFPDKTSGSYLLPIKQSVRKAEDLWADEPVAFSFRLV